MEQPPIHSFIPVKRLSQVAATHIHNPSRWLLISKTKQSWRWRRREKKEKKITVTIIMITIPGGSGMMSATFDYKLTFLT
jgi:hypothetical protein